MDLDLLKDDIDIGEEQDLSKQVVEDNRKKMKFIQDYYKFVYQRKRKYILKRPILEQIFNNYIVPLQIEIDRQGKTPELKKSRRDIDKLFFGKRTSKSEDRIKLLLGIPVYDDDDIYKENKSAIARVSRTRYGGKKRKGKRKTKKRRKRKRKGGMERADDSGYDTEKQEPYVEETSYAPGTPRPRPNLPTRPFITDLRRRPRRNIDFRRTEGDHPNPVHVDV